MITDKFVLKVEYSRVFGYLFEVTNSQKDLVPYRYIRKQTLTNAERYYTQELKELENKILNSKEKALKREIDLFLSLRERLNYEVPKLQATSKLLATLDALISLSLVAIENDYVKPLINKQALMSVPAWGFCFTKIAVTRVVAKYSYI